MSEKPILMTPGNILAIDELRKTRTRRLINPQPPRELNIHHWENLAGCYDGWVACSDKEYPDENIIWPYGQWGSIKPRYAVGDELWITEPWATIREYDKLKPSELTDDAEIWFPDHVGWGIDRRMGRKRSARFMLKRIARKWLRVTEVKAPERGKDISEGDIIAEGVLLSAFYANTATAARSHAYKDEWRTLLTSIYGPDAMEKYFWPIAFEKIERK